MYQLYGRPRFVPAPKGMSASDLEEATTVKQGQILSDGRSPMRVFKGASFALQDINRLKAEGHEIQAAVASRTDEPEWAHFCMKNLVAGDGTTLSECFGELVEISYDNKKVHFRRLHKRTGIPFEQ